MIGIDEVGRGCWAGPLLVVAARQRDTLPDELRDSKAISKKKREGLLSKILTACDVGEGWIYPGEIDIFGLTIATKVAVARALSAINAQLDEPIIIDGNYNYCLPKFNNSMAVIKADATVAIVSAASVYAKVTRDSYMEQLGVKYEKYEFHRHVGYGTKLHAEKINQYGICDLHRLSYKPVQTAINNFRNMQNMSEDLLI